MKKQTWLKKIGSIQLTISLSLIALYLIITVFLIGNWSLSIPINIYIWLLLAGFALIFIEIFILTSKTSNFILKSKFLQIELPNDSSNYSRNRRCWYYLIDATIISIFWIIVDAFSWSIMQDLMSSILVLPFSISLFFFTSYVSTETVIILKKY